MPVKILVISNYTDTHTMRPEAEAFIKLKKVGFEITIMTKSGSYYFNKFKEEGINVIDFQPKKKNDKSEIKIIRDELLKGSYDIMHLFNNKAIVNGIAAAKKLPVKVVIYRGYTGNVNWWDPTAYTKVLHPRVDKITCLTDSVKNSIAKNLFFDKSKLITINKGHDVNWYNDIKVANLQELGIPKDAFVVVNVANARRMKGTKYLLKSTYYLPKDANIHFLIVGRGRDTKKHIKIAENSPNKDKIHFLGFRKDALSIVKASNVFALSSIKGEAITKSVIEAMCIETTPVITDISGNVGLVINKESGMVVPMKNPKAMADAILYLYNNQEDCVQYGKNARKHIDKNFNIERTVKEASEFFNSISKQ
ncbi:MAG: glycosyltransferase family 4 protein [Chlorobi bacterium]|nr:glycosyltransferase family 4 protein [Chlorobiota bacterium]